MADLSLEFDEDDACVLLTGLRGRDVRERIRSHGTGEWMYVFSPRFAGVELYVKLVLRQQCTVISFHEDENE